MRPIVLGIHTVALIFMGLGLAGCAAGAGWAGALVMMMSFAAMFLAGCSESHGTREDAGPIDSGLPLEDGGGTWEACCVEGFVDSCYCPADTACNYGWYVDCPGGGCAYTEEECVGDADAGVDAGGTWEPCCVDGVITTCLCPGGADCNYGWYTDCGSGTCAPEPNACPEGTWEPCCQDGVISSCFCPAGVECNYGWYTDCGDGVCVDPGSTCGPSDAGVADAGGTWDACCVDGAITTCFCPAGLACNYGWYTDCGGGVCVGPTTECPP